MVSLYGFCWQNIIFIYMMVFTHLYIIVILGYRRSGYSFRYKLKHKLWLVLGQMCVLCMDFDGKILFLLVWWSSHIHIIIEKSILCNVVVDNSLVSEGSWFIFTHHLKIRLQILCYCLFYILKFKLNCWFHDDEDRVDIFWFQWYCVEVLMF